MGSRLMDIWSVGMCALEAVFLTPILDPWYQQWLEETGDENKFMQWLGDQSKEPIISGNMRDELAKMNKDMCRLLKGMLSRDPSRRLCITECVNHTWLAPVRKEIQADVDRFITTAWMQTKSGLGDAGDLDTVESLMSDESMDEVKSQLIRQGLTSRACVMM